MTALVALLGILLASFPARNTDIWYHLARGKLLAQGQSLIELPPELAAVSSDVDQGWLFDVVSYGLFTAFGGVGLAAFKAVLIGLLALLLLRLCQLSAGIWLAIFCTVLALLAMSSRLLLQPATLSYLLLALALWCCHRRPATGFAVSLALWPLLVLFVIWAGVSKWFMLGLAVIALVGLGRVLDSLSDPNERPPARKTAIGLTVSLVLLAAAGLLYVLMRPPELRWLPPAASPSAVQGSWGTYFGAEGITAAGLAYFPLVALGLLSFGLLLPNWRWERFLPWATLALLSVFEVRVVPFFAVVAGPVLAWNLADCLARFRVREFSLAVALGRVATLLLVVAGLLCAWPGWLQRPPFEPRWWDIETKPSLERGAAATQHWFREGRLPPEARGLHLSNETALAFPWFCPEEKGIRDAGLAAAVRGSPDAPADWQARMRQEHVNHVILYDRDPGRLFATMERLLQDPKQWPLLYVEGYLAVFGWRDPAAAGNPFAGLQLDLDRLAFQPSEDKLAPPRCADADPEGRAWFEAFWKWAPQRSKDQDEATLRLMHAEALRLSAPSRNQAAWESLQSAALVGAASAWNGPHDLIDAYMRRTFLRPLPPEQGVFWERLPRADQTAHLVIQRFYLHRDEAPPALLYLAVRAARRAVATNPDAAQAYLVLGECYLRFLNATRERGWSEQLQELQQLRRAQASAALNKAVKLRPDFAEAHLALGNLYQMMGYYDLMLKHLRAYMELARRAGPPPGMDPERFSEQAAVFEDQMNHLAHEVELRESKHEVTASGLPVVERAYNAAGQGLQGKALDMLLESDISAFGPRGAALELELLLGTGRPENVLEWLGPELISQVGGATSYHWIRIQALAATGNYEAAREACDDLAGILGPGGPGQESGRLQNILAVTVGQRVLSEYAAGASLPDLMREAYERSDFLRQVRGLAQSLRREADVSVLRGLLALEEGAVDAAEIAFRKALVYWRDEQAAASGAGLDFNGRPIAQAGLHWLEKARRGAP
jgi:tetratricopeptide (TPR) repeat protein